CVEVAAFSIIRVRTAVVDVAADVRERRKERARFAGERMLATATGAVQPPDLSLRVPLCERMKHREHRRYPDAGTDKQHRCVGPVEGEGAAGRCDVELPADGEPAVEIAARSTVVFALDGDPVVAGVRRPGERVVP